MGRKKIKLPEIFARQEYRESIEQLNNTKENDFEELLGITEPPLEMCLITTSISMLYFDSDYSWNALKEKIKKDYKECDSSKEQWLSFLFSLDLSTVREEDLGQVISYINHPKITRQTIQNTTLRDISRFLTSLVRLRSSQLNDT
ncbi:hypothetical protein PCE1_003970 [Barthelona sp. PCE]